MWARPLLLASSLPHGHRLTTSACVRSGWNAELGIWDDRSAMAVGVEEVPNPLYIFGYGSLCWRPDFPHEERWVGRARGWRRLFVQRSTGALALSQPLCSLPPCR